MDRRNRRPRRRVEWATLAGALTAPVGEILRDAGLGVDRGVRAVLAMDALARARRHSGSPIRLLGRERRGDSGLRRVALDRGYRAVVEPESVFPGRGFLQEV